jgi:hypothetical protein
MTHIQHGLKPIYSLYQSKETAMQKAESDQTPTARHQCPNIPNTEISEHPEMASSGIAAKSLYRHECYSYLIHGHVAYHS